MGLLHKILLDAKKWGYIVEGPDFPAITVPEVPPKWMHEDRQELVLNRIKENYPQHYDIILFLRYQGTRPGEARALMWDCVDFMCDQILILRSYDGTTIKEFPKNKTADPIPMHPEVKKMLLSRPRPDIGKHKNFVFLCHGRPYGSNRLSVIWREACNELGFKGVNLYQGTRHSLASQAANRGVSEAIIGKMLRHKDPKSTKQYAHYRTSALRLIWSTAEKTEEEKVKNAKA
jgi:integrase